MLTIGVTGHRYLAEEERLLDGIARALDAIRATYPRRDWAVLSPLAEGADRLAAARLIQDGAALLAVMPLPPHDYRRDFTQPQSLAQFDRMLARARGCVLLPPAPTRNQAYLAVGAFVVAHCHVLLALWDGLPAQGEGGVGDVIAAAHACRKPLAWVRAGNRIPGTQTPTSLGDLQGTLVLENFPAGGAT